MSASSPPRPGSAVRTVWSRTVASTWRLTLLPSELPAEVLATVEHREHFYQIARLHVDDPVPLPYDLADVLDSDLRDHPPDAGVVRQVVRGRVEPGDDGPGVLRGGPPEVLADAVEVVERPV